MLANKAGNASWLNDQEITYLDHGVAVKKLNIASGIVEHLLGGPWRRIDRWRRALHAGTQPSYRRNRVHNTAGVSRY